MIGGKGFEKWLVLAGAIILFSIALCTKRKENRYEMSFRNQQIEGTIVELWHARDRVYFKVDNLPGTLLFRPYYNVIAKAPFFKIAEVGDSVIKRKDGSILVLKKGNGSQYEFNF